MDIDIGSKVRIKKYDWYFDTETDKHFSFTDRMKELADAGVVGEVVKTATTTTTKGFTVIFKNGRVYNFHPSDLELIDRTPEFHKGDFVKIKKRNYYYNTMTHGLYHFDSAMIGLANGGYIGQVYLVYDDGGIIVEFGSDHYTFDPQDLTLVETVESRELKQNVRMNKDELAQFVEDAVNDRFDVLSKEELKQFILDTIKEKMEDE